LYIPSRELAEFFNRLLRMNTDGEDSGFPDFGKHAGPWPLMA
jgi:hypothetical protein